LSEKFKKTIDNAFNAAAKTCDELTAAVPDYVPVSAIGVFVVELCRSAVGRGSAKNQPKQP